MKIENLGWDKFFHPHFKPFNTTDFFPARVSAVYRSRYQILAGAGSLTAVVSGRLRHEAASDGKLPVVGDWVAVKPLSEENRGVIEAVLPRKSALSRNMAGGSKRNSGGVTGEQVLAANVDTVFLVSGLDRDFNLRRIERYITIIYNSGAMPVIILNKADLCADPEEYRSKTESVVPGVPVLTISAARKEGLEKLRLLLRPEKTVALLGSSGVGKSTLLNCLLNEEKQIINPVSTSVGKGVHTTTHRELFLLSSGAMLIDNPGLRELQLWGDDDTGVSGFEDIEKLAEGCRFKDCFHESEPGCAVLAAVDRGDLDSGRLGNYRKLQRELEYLEKRRHLTPNRLEREKWKTIFKKNS